MASLDTEVGVTVDRPSDSGEPPSRHPRTWRDRLSWLDLKVSPYLYISPFFIVFAIVGLFPLVFTGWVALHDWHLLRGQGEFVGLANFATTLGDPYFWNSLVNTVSIFFFGTVPQLIGALVLAALLDQQLRAVTAWRMGVLLPYVVTPVAVALIFSSIFRNAGDASLANNVLEMIGLDPIEWKRERLPSHIAIAAMVNWRWTGYNALILLAAMQAVPRELYEAAAIDGASKVRRFFSVTIPSIRPTLIFVIITATVYGLQIFAEPRLYDVSNAGGIGGAQRQFQTTVLYMWEMGFFRLNLGRASAIAWVLFLFIVTFGLINFALSTRISSAEGDGSGAAKNRRRRRRSAAAAGEVPAIQVGGTADGVDVPSAASDEPVDTTSSGKEAR